MSHHDTSTDLMTGSSPKTQALPQQSPDQAKPQTPLALQATGSTCFDGIHWAVPNPVGNLMPSMHNPTGVCINQAVGP
jgi:hypothetical protein